jgi:tetratricopeptide (TPR) repeat protein
MGESGLAGLTLQRQLSEFLFAEMAHTVGAYKIACDRLEELLREMKQRADETDPAERLPGTGVLEETATAALQCNRHLRSDLHRSTEDDDESSRRPSPFAPGQKKEYFSKRELLADISSFYKDAATALAMHRRKPEEHEKEKTHSGYRLGALLAFSQDPQRRGRLALAQHDVLVKGRIDRTLARHAEINELRGAGKPDPPADVPRPRKAQTDRFDAILEGWAGGKHSLLVTILQAMTESHMAMHEAEHIRAQTFGQMFGTIPETHKQAQRLLRYALALNTFVFAAARATPWIFAEDVDERDFVIANYARCCETLAPTYCMWIASQVGLTSLHRRAFTWWTLGRHDRAYRDFHKLTRLLRGLRKPAARRGLRVPGTKTFIEGVTAMSEHHIGRIYRGQHAHRLALRYFQRASAHLKGWEDDDEIGPLIKNSHWRLNRLINEGKAYYELGRVKRSILCYARAWRAFLLLVDSETHATANLEVVEEFAKWLEPVVDDPELNRRELRDQVEPLVNQFVTLRTPPHLRLLAADIVMRMGHLLFILKLPRIDWDPSDREDDRGTVDTDHDLAGKCIGKAAFLDPSSTLTAADRLKIEQETEEPVEVVEPISATPLEKQWPSGSGRFEEAARIIEYTLQRWLAATPGGGGVGEGDVRRPQVARHLLASFLAHTDSSNVKLAQVYRYLMQEPRERLRDTGDRKYTLDLACLRRYSSFFPFLPRPSAFRAPGGGYFVHLREKGKKAEPFGIAIDPGPDFIENLYRCGYGLADIHMIVLTHDHADHIASLDAMLALMGIRMGLGDDTFKRKGKRLAIVGNQSVYERYGFFNDESEKSDVPPMPRIDAVKVLTFEQMEEITTLPPDERSEETREPEILLKPETLRIERVRSWGHADANGHISQAFMLRFGADNARSSILFTGDTGLPSTFGEDEAGEPQEPQLLAPGKMSLRQAVEEADVVVAHLSSVPLRELRELADLESTPADEAIEEFRKLWKTAVKNTAFPKKTRDPDQIEGIRQTRFLLNQLQFGFRSRPENKKDGFAVSPFSDLRAIKGQPERHLYLTGLLDIAKAMAQTKKERPPLLLIGELREELGTFRTRIAHRIAEAYFDPVEPQPSALTTDIGLRVRLAREEGDGPAPIEVLCSTCDLDNDLIPVERFHSPREIHEVCVKGEDEGVFYNCALHDPRSQDDYFWLESVERFDVFGD